MTSACLRKLSQLTRATKLFCVARPTQHVLRCHLTSCSRDKRVEFFLWNHDEISFVGELLRNGYCSHGDTIAYYSLPPPLKLDFLCRGGDSNSHESPHTLLKRTCLPISPPRRRSIMRTDYAIFKYVPIYHKVKLASTRARFISSSATAWPGRNTTGSV